MFFEENGATEDPGSVNAGAAQSKKPSSVSKNFRNKKKEKKEKKKNKRENLTSISIFNQFNSSSQVLEQHF